jgi:hypothetical protein
MNFKYNNISKNKFLYIFSLQANITAGLVNKLYILMKDPAVKKEVSVEEKEILLHVKEARLGASDTIPQHNLHHPVQVASDRLACLRAIVNSSPENIDTRLIHFVVTS